MSGDSLAHPSPAQLEWHDMEMGMFFHFDIPVYKPGWEWRSWTGLPDPNLYQPTKLDTDQWMEAAKAVGARYAVFVAKHCSGFLQWQSDLYPYGLKQTSWRSGKGDVVADFIESCHKYGIKPGLYASVSANAYLEVDNPGLVNRGKGGDILRQRDYNGICEQMATELWSRYGDLFELWFDGGALPPEQNGPDLIPIMKRYQPNAISFQGPPGADNLVRWVGNERGVAPYPCWNTSDEGTSEGGTVEKCFAGHSQGSRWIPGECDVPIRNHAWFWKEGDEHKIYSLDELMEMYYCSVGRNCNLLINANPNTDGLVPEQDMRRYEEFGREIKRRFSTAVASTKGTGIKVSLDLNRLQQIDHVVLMEDIAHGERILEYVVEYLGADQEWKVLCSGESIGHKCIQKFPAIRTSGIRLRVIRSKAEPYIRELAVYNTLEQVSGFDASS